jgi:hypothetical protein
MANLDGGYNIDIEEEELSSRGNPSVRAPGTPKLVPVQNSLQIIQDEPELAAKIPAIVQLIERGCGPEEAQRFADSLRAGIDVGNEALHIIEGITRSMNKALNLKDRQMEAHFASVTRGQRTAPAVSGPSAQERSTRRKMLSERLPPLVKGISIAHWIDQVKSIVRQDGSGMTSSEILDAVTKAAKSNTDVALAIDSATAGKFMHDVTELFVILTRLFKPDSRGHLSALRSKEQRDNQPAAEYMNEVKALGYAHWVGLPEKPETFDLIINNMSDKHRAFMRDKWNTMHVAMEATDNPNPMTFAHLLTWALDSDAEYATNQQHKRSDGRTTGKANTAQGDTDKDKKSYTENRTHQYRGRGRGGARGQVNYNQGFQEKSPFSFMLQLTVSSSESDSESDLDINTGDLSPDGKLGKRPKPSRDEGGQLEGFKPVIIENRRFAAYVPSGQVARKRKHELLREARSAVRQRHGNAAQATTVSPAMIPPVTPSANPSAGSTDFVACNNDEIDEVLCGMMQGVGPMSGTSYESLPPNCFALNNRRPHRAENFRPADRDDVRTPAHQPPLYFHQPENRIASSVITTTLGGLVKLCKNVKWPKFVDVCDDLFSSTVRAAQSSLAEIGIALNRVAAEENIAFTCSCDGKELPTQGGEYFHTSAGTLQQPILDRECTIQRPNPTYGGVFIEPMDCMPAGTLSGDDIPTIFDSSDADSRGSSSASR